MPRKMPRARRGIIRDRIKPRDFNSLQLIYSCEQCSFYEVANKKCNFGLKCEPHLRENQIKTYHLCGMMAFCRFMEID